MPIVLNTTPADHIPEDFTVESLLEGGLTEQEIKALSEGDDPIVQIPDQGGDKDGAQAAQPTQPQVGDAPPENTQAAAPDQGAQEPVYPQIPDTTEAEATIQRVNTALEALADEYDNGDLTKAEFLAKQTALVQEQAKAQVAIENAATALQQAQAAAVAHWNARMAAYQAVAPGLWSEAHVNAWDAYLRSVTSNPAYADLTRDQQIQLAHRNYASDYEIRTGQPLSGDAALPKAGAKAAKLEVRDDERPEPVKTLRGFNSDTTAEVEDSSFAAIDRTIGRDPLEAERMFQRMTPEQQERYLTEV